MSFSGTIDKCKSCEKTVYVVDILTIDGIPYHKKCFRCSHCNGPLEMSNYSSMDGILYCKTHFEQLFKESGSFTKNFQTVTKTDLNRTPSRLSSLFSGTQDKCATCKKTAYPLETLTVEGESYHKSCFRCSHGGCPLTTSSFAALDGILYCKHHFAQLFKEKGTYSHLVDVASKKNSATATSNPNESIEMMEEES